MNDAKKENDRLLEIHRILNEPGITKKVRRALLRTKFGLDETLIDELCPLEPDSSDY